MLCEIESTGVKIDADVNEHIVRVRDSGRWQYDVVRTFDFDYNGEKKDLSKPKCQYEKLRFRKDCNWEEVNVFLSNESGANGRLYRFIEI